MNDRTNVFLLVEDDAYDRAIVQEVFQRGNCRLEIVGDGLEAQEYLEGRGGFSDKQRYPLPDVILLDLTMPLLNGFGFLEWLRTQEAPLRLIPVVVMSGSQSPQDMKRAYELGANSYLVKPVNWDEFRQRMKMLNIYWCDHVQTPRDGVNRA
jgi:CheY-like chemotaxis protein